MYYSEVSNFSLTEFEYKTQHISLDCLKNQMKQKIILRLKCEVNENGCLKPMLLVKLIIRAAKHKLLQYVSIYLNINSVSLPLTNIIFFAFQQETVLFAPL